ncbi:hypothetical protein MMC18_006586 [Xylographa bjoerkii]|nr:hypothetical protein [Xylographa bjoerkii]
MALSETTQSEPPAVSETGWNSGSSRSSSLLSDIARSPSPTGSLLLEVMDGGSTDEQTGRLKPLFSALLKEEFPPYLYTDLNSFVPPALDLYRPVATSRGVSTPSITLASIAIRNLPSTTITPSTRCKNTARASRFFPRAPAEKLSCIPFPALNATSFGLVQERLCNDPFRLLVAVMFLNKTRGKVALPVCYDLFARYPSPEDLASANFEELSGMIHELGLQNQRAERMIKLAQTWVKSPPKRGQRYRMLHYPGKEDGKDIPKGSDPVDDDDPRTAWEVAHLPGTGTYALDSWRIFCRDGLRGIPTGLQEDLDAESIELEMRQEWTRVLPLDKELRAYLRWRWLRLGWTWNPMTGEKDKLDKEVCKEVENGGIALEGDNTWAIEGMITASGSGESSTAVGEIDMKETTGTKAQIDIGNQMSEQPGDICVVEIHPERQTNQESAELHTVAHVQTTSEPRAQEDNALDANEAANDNTDGISEAISSALRWLHESTPQDAVQIDTEQIPKNETAIAYLPLIKQPLGGRNEPLPVSSQNFFNPTVSTASGASAKDTDVPEILMQQTSD